MRKHAYDSWTTYEKMPKKRRVSESNRKDRNDEYGYAHKEKTKKSRRRRPLVIPRGERQYSRQAPLQERPRNNRVCDLGRSSCCDCNYCDHCLQAKITRALEFDSDGYQQFIKNVKGQSTVEYAVIVSALIGIVLALGMVGSAIKGGLFTEHALSAASHCVTSSISGIIDALCY